MKPWNSAYRKNVKYICEFLAEQYPNNIRIEGYSNEWIGCDIICKLGANYQIVIWCCTGEYVEDKKKRPFYVIRYEKGEECIRYSVYNLKQIYNFFELSKVIGYKNAGEYIDKQTKRITEELKIKKDFV